MKKLSVLALCLLLAIPSFAQFNRQPSPNDTLVPLRVDQNGVATFSIYAPKAVSVMIMGDIYVTNFREGRNGVWTGTAKVEPGAYRYRYIIDGNQVLDPKAPETKDYVPVVNIVPPGQDEMFFEQKDVPHGAMATVYYPSKTLGKTRRMHVWTPAGYNASKDKLPVFYLLHGGGDNDFGWPTIGRAGEILDNLLAEGKMKPMIVVMPDGSIATETFIKDLHDDIIPYVEANYRVKTGAANRALAGLSQGGLHVTEFIAAYPDVFAYINIMSSGWFVNNEAMYEKGDADLKRIAPVFQKTVKLLRFTTGGQPDSADPNCKKMMTVFDKYGYKYEFSSIEGGHTWYTWRHDLYNFAQKLFK